MDLFLPELLVITFNLLCSIHSLIISTRLLTIVLVIMFYPSVF
jgi:hypothetical protein